LQHKIDVKHIIVVGSGKGGVGKSTVSVNLALALLKTGAKVGLLDADIYGPSQPAMLGTEDQKPVLVGKTFEPVMSHGLQTMSIGYLIDKSVAMVWRGPMIGKAIQQLLEETKWHDLDYLIVDLPPGTGDIQLTLCQKITINGAVLVTTPQDLALLDVRRACEMFTKLNVPIMGVVENMSVYHCPQCGHEEAIFGQGGGEKIAKEYQLSMLGTIPLDGHIREMTDAGHPPVVQAPESHYAKAFQVVAENLIKKIAAQPKNYASIFPKIVVEHNKKEQ
jgi:ATP-binding protein involved in chromosome partitioning